MWFIVRTRLRKPFSPTLSNKKARFCGSLQDFARLCKNLWDFPRLCSIWKHIDYNRLYLQVSINVYFLNGKKSADACSNTLCCCCIYYTIQTETFCVRRHAHWSNHLDVNRVPKLSQCMIWRVWWSYFADESVWHTQDTQKASPQYEASYVVWENFLHWTLYGKWGN